MYSNSKEQIKPNLENLAPELFNTIVAPLSYKSDLARLSMTSKTMQLNVLNNTPSGELVKELKVLQQTSKFRDFFAPAYSYPLFCLAGANIGLGIGLVSAKTYTGMFFTSAAGYNFGNLVCSVGGGYIIDGYEGAKNGFYNSNNSQIPMFIFMAKHTLKTSLNLLDIIMPFVAPNKLSSLANLIDDRTEIRSTISQYFNFFKESNDKLQKNIQEKQTQLSHPIPNSFNKV